MATNLKGKGRFASLLLLHGEKLAIGLVAVVALWIVYSALKLPRLDNNYQADKLQNELTQTTREVKEYTWDKAVTDHPDKIRTPKPITAKGDGSVDPAQYVNRDAKNKPVFAFDNAIVAPLILRADPVMLNA